METQIHEYIYHKKQRVGVIAAALAPDSMVHFGWSLCNRKSGDKFNREIGLNIAVGRARAKVDVLFPVPRSIEKSINMLAGRASKYFKDRQVMTFDAVIDQLKNKPCNL